jgi:hypothetical protein
MPEGPDAPDADWSDPRRLPPISGGSEVLDPSDYDATFDEWLEHVDADYPPEDQPVEPARPTSYLHPENLACVRQVLWGV